MTIRLYEQNAYCCRFDATVLRCSPMADGFAIVLDRTAFFPEGGGQSADTGALGSAAVRDVQIVGDAIEHYTDTPLAVGERVTGEINWAVRFARMQKHTGEHIVSGLVHRLYGFDNVGFHLGSEDVTLDFNGELTREQLDHIEDLANEAIWNNVAVTASFPSPEELATLAYRSKKELSGDIRIVTVEGYDRCACCAPHVSRTGEIGVLKLLDAIRYKGGMRVHMQCGRDALSDYRMRFLQTTTVAASLSVKQQETVQAVVRLIDQRDTLTNELRQMKRRLAMAYTERVEQTDRPVCLMIEPVDMDTVREAAVALAARCTGVCAVFAGTDADGYQYAVTGGDDLCALSDKMKTQLDARGGGSAKIIQGRVMTTGEVIRWFFDTL